MKGLNPLMGFRGFGFTEVDRVCWGLLRFIGFMGFMFEFIRFAGFSGSWSSKGIQGLLRV